jgi:ATP-dependent RNA helicase DHX57
VSHVVLDEVHERNLESDLLLLLLRRTLLTAQAAGSSSSRPPKVLLMSATADADLFAGYFTGAGPEALLLGQQAGAAAQQQLAQRLRLSVGLLSIPGFTHPVRQMWLEDALQATGIVVGKQSRWVMRMPGTPCAQQICA